MQTSGLHVHPKQPLEESSRTDGTLCAISQVVIQCPAFPRWASLDARAPYSCDAHRNCGLKAKGCSIAADGRLQLDAI